MWDAVAKQSKIYSWAMKSTHIKITKSLMAIFIQYHQYDLNNSFFSDLKRK